MSLPSGQRIGVYEIMALVGAGGMGEVYRARDTKLNRDVAIKVLPELLGGDADRLARFQREAQVLASLNHPNIAHIHGSEDSGSVHALVMELVEGPTLADRIAQGAIPLADALPIARQIADALEAAHEQGIVHRDLKPANVKVKDDGTVKVLDFGLAKAVEADASASSPSAMNSPTLTARATQLGMILGTAAYMAPEQARGRAVDRRADIWAFGVVVYEMLTGRRAFDGDDISITLASVLKEDVRWDALPKDLPPSVWRLLRRCLEKDPKRRLSAIGDARLEMDEAISGSPEAHAATAAGQERRTADRSGLRMALPWIVAGVFGTGLIAAIAVWAPWRTLPAPTPRRLLASSGADGSLVPGGNLALSPDGLTLAFVGAQNGATRLFVRKLDQLQATPLLGTEAASMPFFSPNGQWIAFFAGGSLKKVSVTGGATIPLCETQIARGGTWSDDDQIYFTPSASVNTRIMRVSAAGGTPVPAAALSANATSQRWPQALPGNAGLLFTEHSSTGAFDGANIVVVPLEDSGGAPKVVVRGGYFGRYVAAPKRFGRDGGSGDGGVLVYMQQGTLFSAPFDLRRLEVTGPALPALQGVAAATTTASAEFAIANGTLVYLPGSATTSANPLDWITRDGKASPLRATKAEWSNVRISPDGQRLALDLSDGKQRDVWVYEWSRDTLTQLTFDPADDTSPVWTPDGRRIVFASDRAKKGTPNLYWVNADGTGDVTRLTDSPSSQYPGSWHPSGKFLAFHENNLTGSVSTSWDLMILPMEGDSQKGWTAGKPTVFLATPATEVVPRFSPDGRWIAYQSNEHAGVFDVYVRPFPGPGGVWRISTDGEWFPTWSRSANELLFVSPVGKISFAPYSVIGDSFRADKAQAWTSTLIKIIGTATPFDIHADGKRLVGAAQVDQATTGLDKLVFVFDFYEYLASTMPGAKR
jgi:serine/threonine-protein kinase